MKLNLDILPFGRSTTDVEETYRLDFEDGDAGEVRMVGELQVENAESRVLVHGELKVTGSAECDRCLTDFEMQFPAEVEVVIVRAAPKGDPGEGEHEEGSAMTILQARGVVDLDPILSETALLAMPQKMVCSEDCLGICAYCGANRNKDDCDCNQDIVDPRWDGLPS